MVGQKVGSIHRLIPLNRKIEVSDETAMVRRESLTARDRSRNSYIGV